MKKALYLPFSVLIAVTLAGCSAGEKAGTSAPQPSSESSLQPSSESSSAEEPSSESSMSQEESTSSSSSESKESFSESSSFSEDSSFDVDGEELLTDKKGHGSVDSTYVEWYLAGSGSLWSKDDWSKGDAVRLYSNPTSASDKGCVLEIAFKAGDVFKVTDYGATWFGYEKVDTYASPDNLGLLNFEGVDDGHQGKNFRCKVDGVYNMYINAEGFFWIENAEFKVVTEQQAFAIVDSWTVEAARSAGFTKCKLVQIDGDQRREEEYSVNGRWDQAMEFSKGMILSYWSRKNSSTKVIFKAKGTALESREYDRTGCRGVIRVNHVGLFEFSKTFPDRELHYIWLKG